MKIKFRYGGLDGRVWWISATTLLLLGAAIAYLWWSAAGALYLAAWVSMTSATIIALCLLSVPRRIIIGDEELELRCLVETTYIPLSSIADVEVVEENGLRNKIPLLGIYGFWGYYGHYIDLSTGRLHRVYTTKRKGCVAIHTSKRRYLVSCNAPEMLRVMILGAKARCSKEA